MQFLKSTAYVILLTLLAISATVNVRAQSASTSIMSWDSPSRVLVGRDLTITVRITYDRGSYTSDAVYVAIINTDATTYENAFPTGSASSSPDACSLDSDKTTDCIITSPASNSGTESVTFHLSLDQVRTWNLDIATGIQENSSPYSVESSSDSYQKFTVTVTNKVNLIVSASYTIPLTVDGVPQGLSTVFSIDVDPGSHTLSTPQTVDINAGERLRFDHWSDGSTSTTDTVDLQNDASYSVVYVTQYKLTLATNQSVATGEDWYDEDTTAEFSVPSSVPMNGILGTLGAKYDFQAWYEGKSLISSSSNSSLKMNSQHSLTANWTPNYTAPIIIVGVAIIAVLGLTFYLIRRKEAKPRRRRTRRKKPDQVTEEPIIPEETKPIVESKQVKATEPIAGIEKTKMFCTQCGATIPRDSKFCKECGANTS